MSIIDWHQLETHLAEYAFNYAIQFLAMLQGTGAVKGHLAICVCGSEGSQVFIAQDLTEILRQLTDAPCLLSITRIA